MNQEFWEHWAAVGKEILEYGEDVKYGSSLLEVKFYDGKPAVIIRSKSVKTKYEDNAAAEVAIGKVLTESTKINFDGARTFTVAYNRGKITQVILDQYSNDLLR